MSGHKIRNPFGVVIEIPNRLFRQLKILGCYKRGDHRKDRIGSITIDILPFLNDPRFLKFAGEDLRNILGRDCSGPNACSCECHKCLKPHEEADTTATTNEQYFKEVYEGDLASGHRKAFFGGKRGSKPDMDGQDR